MSVFSKGSNAFPRLKNEWSIRTLVSLAGRQYLPGSHGNGFPKFLNSATENFPYRICAHDVGITKKATPVECADSIQTESNLQSKLLKYGALLLRGFPIATKDDFSQFFDSLGLYRKMQYIGGAGVRNHFGGGVYSASREEPKCCIDLHNEMAYLNHWPTLVLFHCVVPPSPGCGGETGISDVREYVKHIDSSVRETFRRLGVMYHHYSPDKTKDSYQNWQEIFQTESRIEVEEMLKEVGDSFEWKKDGALSRWRTRPAFINHPVTNESLWFNHAHKKHGSGWEAHPDYENLKRPYNLYPTHNYYGNGKDIEDDVIQHLRNSNWTCAVGFQLQRNDVLIMENHLVQHSRLSFTGERHLLAILADVPQHHS